MNPYSSRDVAELLGMAPAQVRAFARAGFLTPDRGPRRHYRFSFQDVVLLRTAKGLAEAHIPAKRIHRALRKLQQQLPRGRPLSEVRIASEGDRVVVRDRETTWNPVSGQVSLDFSVRDLATRIAPLARQAAEVVLGSGKDLTADDWYELALDLEACAPEEAKEAYRRALQLDSDFSNARVNLGRLLQESGNVAEAIDHYQAALRIHPKHSTAAFNLGTALEDLQRPGQAIEAYKQALAGDSEFADAHYNLSRLYEKGGNRAAALRHLRSYKMLVEGGARS
ncbi:MAG: tetratricopeptide repeat protein [Acidobacteria bacterium]|nr:tetratricopeptide repeat protein [Acidobacteriota bacterium]